MHEHDCYPQDQITGVVLAGGRGRRMGGVDKGLELLAGRPMAAYAVAALREQCGQVLLNANRNGALYAELGCRVFADASGDFDGPLAGIATGLAEAGQDLVLFAPCDSPLVSPLLGERLYQARARAGAEIAVAHDGERLHPVFALIPAALSASAAAFLAAGERKIDLWYAQHHTVKVPMQDLADSFLNINRIADKAALEARLAR